MKNYDGDRIFSTLSNKDVIIGRNLLEMRTWNDSDTRKIQTL